MSKQKIFLLIILIGAAIGALSLQFYLPRTAMAPESTSDNSGKQSMLPYRSSSYLLSFEYPSGLYLKEHANVGTEERPQLSVVLVEDNQFNRDLLDGKITEATDGPISITIDAYQNPQRLDSEAWAKQDTNWNISSKILTPTALSGENGFSFNWDGLYPGRSVVIAKGNYAYVLSVTWNSPEDQILKDFEMILNSVKLGE